MTSLQSNPTPSDPDMDELCLEMEFLSIEDFEDGPAETCLHCTGEGDDGDYMCKECRTFMMNNGYFPVEEDG